MPGILSDNGHLGCCLDRLNVLSLPTLLTLGYVELHFLPFLQAAEAARLNSGEVHEDIISRFAANEAVAFGVVEPLNCSLFHLILLFPLLSCAEKSRGK
jgi:hypothetical protein